VVRSGGVLTYCEAWLVLWRVDSDSLRALTQFFCKACDWLSVVTYWLHFKPSMSAGLVPNCRKVVFQIQVHDLKFSDHCFFLDYATG